MLRFLILALALLITGSCINAKLDWSAAGDGGGPPGATGKFAITPAAGARGLTLTITGSALAAETLVTVGGVACTPVTVISEAEITCRIGRHATGVVDVVVQNAGASPTTLPGAFTYLSFLYALSPGGMGKVSAFAIDDTSGILTPLSGSPFPGLVSASALAISPEGRFLYATSSNHASIHLFSIDPATGALALVTSDAGTTGTFSTSLAFDPLNHFLFTTTSPADAISTFRIGEDGSLTGVSGSDFGTLQDPLDGGFSRDGRYFYATQSGLNHGLNSFTVAPEGSVDHRSNASIPTSTAARSLCEHPTRDLLYTVGGFEVAAWAIDASGDATPIPGSVVGIGNGAHDCYVHPLGQYVFVSATDADRVTQLFVGATGDLSTVVDVAEEGQPRRIAMSNGGTFLFVARFFADKISTRPFDAATGTLGPSAVLTPTEPGPTFLVVD